MNRGTSHSEPTEWEALSDRELILRFADDGEQAAFRAIVDRHGSLVFRVCRGILRHHQDAEDAFQATFLVLARKAGRVRWQSSLATWLYGTARRIALKASTRLQKEHTGAMEDEPGATDVFEKVAACDAERVLHEELDQLPKQLRAPLILCYLEGKTQKEAAEELAVPPTTINGRLQRGRLRLRLQLTRRGIGLAFSAAAIGETLSIQPAGAATWISSSLSAPTQPLVNSTVQAASEFASSLALSNAANSHAMTLAKGELTVLTSTTTVKLSAATAGLLVSLGISWLLVSSDASAKAFKSVLPLEAQLAAEPVGAQWPSTEIALGDMYVVIEDANSSEAPSSNGTSVEANAPTVSPDTPSFGSEASKDSAVDRMTVIVTDSEGRRVSGAKVFQNHVYLQEGQHKIKNHEYVTDAQGNVAITWPGDSEDLRLWISKPGYVPLHAMWSRRLQADGDEPPTEFEFQLSSGTSIGGVVQDEQGQPIAGARIEIQNVAAVFPVTPNDPGERPVPAAWLAEGESAIVTDEHGRWTAQNIPSDGAMIALIVDRHAEEHRRWASFNNSIAPFRQDLLAVPLRLRVSHPDYDAFDAVENPKLHGQPTLAELRKHEAAIALHRRADHAVDENATK